jgi:hypothetical protein
MIKEIKHDLVAYFKTIDPLKTEYQESQNKFLVISYADLISNMTACAIISVQSRLLGGISSETLKQQLTIGFNDFKMFLEVCVEYNQIIFPRLDSPKNNNIYFFHKIEEYTKEIAHAITTGETYANKELIDIEDEGFSYYDYTHFSFIDDLFISRIVEHEEGIRIVASYEHDYYEVDDSETSFDHTEADNIIKFIKDKYF